MSIEAAVTRLTTLMDTMECYQYLIDKEIDIEGLGDLSYFLEGMIAHANNELALVRDEKGTDDSSAHTELMVQVSAILREYDNKLDECLRCLAGRVDRLSKTRSSDADDDNDDDLIPSLAPAAEVALRTHELVKFSDALAQLRLLNPTADVVTQLEAHQTMYMDGSMNLGQFKDACTQDLCQASRSDLAEQSMFLKGLYLLLNIVTGLATAGIVPLYAYATKKTLMFFPVPETEAVKTVHSIQNIVSNILSLPG